MKEWILKSGWTDQKNEMICSGWRLSWSQNEKERVREDGKVFGNWNWYGI